MITYTATNTETGKFYIGSALDYGRYLQRVASHHNVKPTQRGYTQFQKDLQQNPHSFKWEWSEDDRDDRSTEESLIQCFSDSPFLYNVGMGNYERTEKHRGWTHTEETRRKQSEKNKENYENNPERRERVRQKMRETNSRRVTCEHCGKTTNPGNYSRYHKDGKCQRG